MIVRYLDFEFYSSFNYNLITGDNIKKNQFCKSPLSFSNFLIFSFKNEFTLFALFSNTIYQQEEIIFIKTSNYPNIITDFNKF